MESALCESGRRRRRGGVQKGGPCARPAAEPYCIPMDRVAPEIRRHMDTRAPRRPHHIGCVRGRGGGLSRAVPCAGRGVAPARRVPTWHVGTRRAASRMWEPGARAAPPRARYCSQATLNHKSMHNTQHGRYKTKVHTQYDGYMYSTTRLLLGTIATIPLFRLHKYQQHDQQLSSHDTPHTARHTHSKVLSARGGAAAGQRVGIQK